MIKANEFKISCSAIGKIMTNPKKGETGLSVGAKTYCREWLISKVYGRKNEFTAKTTDKGNKTEEDAIIMLEQHYQWPFTTKNNRRVSNGILTGECDVVLPDQIVDIKSSYSCFTFPLLANEIPETDYIWQIQGYMELWSKKKGAVCFVLMDMPHEMIERELRYRLPREYTKEQYDTEYAKFIYSDIPMQYRVKKFEFEYNAAMIEQVNTRVEQCRKYIAELIKELPQ